MMNWLKKIQHLFQYAIPRTNYFKRLVWLGCISVSLPLIILGSAYYQISVEKLKHQFQEDSLTSLTQLKDRTESAMTSVEYQSLQLLNNPSLRSALGQPTFSEQFVTQMELLDYMQVQKNASPLIQDIIFYNSMSDTVLTNFYGKSTLENSTQQSSIQAAMNLTKSEGWTYFSGNHQNGYISYVRQLPVMRTGPLQGLLIYQVKASEIEKLIFQSVTDKLSESLIVIDPDNTILLHSTDSSLLGKSTSELPLYKNILNYNGKNQSFITTNESGEKFLTAINKSSLGRTYISLWPEQELTKQLNWLRLLIVSSVLIILIFGIILTIASSKFAYSPIDQLIRYGGQLRNGTLGRISGSGNEFEYIRSSLAYLNEQANSLQNYVQKIQPALRDQFMMKLLLSSNVVKLAEVEDGCRSFQLPMSGNFAVLIVRPENLFKEKRFFPNEGPVIAFAVKNVMHELIDYEHISEGFVLGEDGRESIAVLHFKDSANETDMHQALLAYATKIREILRTHLSFDVSIGIGGLRSEIALISESYKEASRALQQRLFDDNRTIFQYQSKTATTERLTLFNYPKDIELSITEYLLQGDHLMAKQSLQLFYERIRISDSYNTAIYCYHILLSSIIQSLEEMGYGVLDNLGDNLFVQLKARQTYSEVQEWFIEVLFPIHKQIAEQSRTNTTRKAVQLVCQHIEANQGMPSLIECAELVQISPSYLSRLFKQEAGMTFIEYLMKYKVERAKKLLEETNYSITEIAEIIGYSERNLNRAFQRHVMMSPNQYRLSLR
ncbi:helix-turn-helix domain-containing protein [Paenibacillus anseongense]|uniref:helix-turn-helix domain-containing protein n=1 Tax=Paenibacillus TaxID=44249 RepID=UPI002DB89B5B|nr:helix-turn-helix domain-containing protein [Paenibacillus anseongense]MEC0270355.1 helix-turn-helix domain-containing protein [Paenibacillus anseongense]